MKKLALFLILALSTPAFAQQADYGGIWRASIDPGAFVVVTQRGNSLVIAALDSDGMWDAYIGSIGGTSASVTTVIGRATISMTVSFVSSTQAVAKLTSCTPKPGFICTFPIGSEITYNKIY